MSLFSDNRYCWRETYFILCHPARRPKLAEVEKGLAKLFPTLRMRDSQSDADGHLELLSVISLEDNAGLDVVYQAGESVRLETASLLEEFQHQTSTTQSLEQIERARAFEARLELLHFERIELPPESPQTEVSDAAPVPVKTTNPFGWRKHFAFDPNSQNPVLPEYSYKPIVGEDDDDPDETSERLAPNTLILAIELLVAQTSGMALDPSSGFFL